MTLLFTGFTTVLSVVTIVEAAAQSTESFERIKTEEDFIEAVVGKALIYENGVKVLFLEDKSLGGNFFGSPVWGEWVWRDDKVCHQFNVGEKRYKVDCRIPEFSEKKIQFRRDDDSTYGVARIESAD